MKEHILCAANSYDTGEEQPFTAKGIKQTEFVICGRRHANCISMFARIYGFPYSPKALAIMRTEEQGFLTNTNRFVSRIEALKIATEANQIITGEGNSSLGLFSEDIY